MKDFDKKFRIDNKKSMKIFPYKIKKIIIIYYYNYIL